MAQTRVVYERSFDTLLSDSVALLLHARQIDAADSMYEPAIHGCILNTLLLIECAANTCVDALRLDDALYQDIDKLPPLAKFELFLRLSKSKKTLDRGNVHVQQLQEMKRLRDGVVHLKTNRVDWEQHGDGRESVSPSRFNASQVAKNIKFWSYEDAVGAMKAVHGFLKYFFVDVCGYSRVRVAALLFSEERHPTNSKDYARPVFSRPTKRFLASEGVPLDYIHLAWA